MIVRCDTRATRVFVRLACVSLLVIPLLVAPASAQVAGRNVNMVTGGTFPGGDPFLQKQNEPSIAVSTRNPCHLLAGANDYRAVNLQGLPEDHEVGDAWLGWYESTDCGATWYSTLVPGFLQDNSPEGLQSPVKGLTTGADPVVRAGGSGTFYYLFIAFNRGSNVGKLALARAIDHNDREVFIDPDAITDVSLRRQRSPIKYAGTVEIARGSGGQFIDKPHMAVFPSTGTCTIDGETVPANRVYVSWTEFVGNNPENQRSKVMFARSADCGATLEGPAQKLTEGYPLNQGSVIAINPNNSDEIFVIWRQIRSDRTQDAILFARSMDGGRSFTKAASLPGLGEGQYKPFDQNTTSTLRGNLTTTFRTLGYPTAAFADDGFLYLAVTQPEQPNPSSSLGGINARINIMRTNGTIWTDLVPAVPSAGNGHQIMPALTYAAGKLHMIWYDVRFDESGLTDRPLIDEAEAVKQPKKIRHTLDVLGGQAKLPIATWPTAADPPLFQLYGVVQPDFNDPPSPDGPPLPRGPRISQYAIGDANPPSGSTTNADGGARQLQFNLAGLLLYGGGTIPFLGDYIDVAGTSFVWDPVLIKWMPNGQANANNLALGTFHAAWTDHRDATIGQVSPNAPLPYSPPQQQLPANSTLRDTVPCSPDNTRTRDANVYTSRITQDFSLTVPGNAKPTNTPGVVRAFAVELANGTDAAETFTLSLLPGDLDASFSRNTFASSENAAPGSDTCATIGARVGSLTVSVLPKSAVARTVYVACGSNARRRIVLRATRLSDGVFADAVLNSDPSTPVLKDEGGAAVGLETHNPDAENPDAENPDAENPDAENPDAENPDAENPDAENPDAENPDAENPDAENPDAENPDAENPDAENPDAENANFQDVTADVTNTGNTTSGFQIVVNTTTSTAGYQFLLLANRVYSTPTSIDCFLVKRRTNQQLFAIPLSGNDLTTGDFFDENSPDPRNATVLVRPGETIRVKLRVVWNSTLTTKPFCLPGQCHNVLEFRTRALAPNTGEVEPAEDSVGSRGFSTFLSFTEQPTDSFTNVPIESGDGPVEVTARDGAGAPIAGVQVTMSLGDNPGDTSLGGTVTQVTNASGVATFANLTIDQAAAGYTLLASAPDAGAEESNAFDVTDSLVVLNTSNSGVGSLRQAILDANANPGLDRIAFDIFDDGVPTVFTITPAELLPEILDPVIIDATTQSGYSGTPMIEIQGTNFTLNDSAPGLALRSGASGSRIEGLGITAFGQSGIRLSATDGVVIKSNYLGIDPVSGNAIDSVTGAPQGNGIGIYLIGAFNTVVGGPVFGDGNTIGGNTKWGIAMEQHIEPLVSPNSNLVQGNVIGVWDDTDGAGNGTADSAGGGVLLSGGAFNNRVGGTAERTAQNLIGANLGPGIHIHAAAGLNNVVQYNRIDNNTGLGIDLGPVGVTANDTLDPDTGGNNLQNSPALTDAEVNGSGTVTITGTFNSEAGQFYVIDFYENPSCGDGARQGELWFGAAIVQTDTSGNATINFGFGGGVVTAGQGVTATATRTPDGSTFYPAGSTSEISNCVVVGTAAMVGTLSDPTGDAGGGPDLVSSTVTADDGNLTVSVRFAAGTFNATSTIVNLALDTDENASTGNPGVDSGCVSDAATMGSDFVVNTGGHYGENVQVNQAAGGTCPSWGGATIVGTRTVVTDGVDFVIPLSALGGDDGRLRFKVLSATSLPETCPTCSSSVQDYMTNVGLPPGQVPNPPPIL